MLTHDPRSGDYGLGFFGHALESGAYLVQHPELGQLCYLCDLTSSGSSLTLIPTDSFHRNVFIEPLALYLSTEAGTIQELVFDSKSKQITITFATPAPCSRFRLKLRKTAAARPGSNFYVDGAALVRGAFEISTSVIKVRWSN